MGLLVPIVHAERVSGPDEAAALFRALRADLVLIDGFRARTPERRALLVKAIAPETNSTIEFERGTLGEPGFDALHELVESGGAGYIDVVSGDARLRVWPTSSRVHLARVPPSHRASLRIALESAMSRVFGRPITIAEGTTTVDATHVTIDPSAAAPVDIRTDRAEIAFQLFVALAGQTVDSGHVSAPNRTAIERLLPLLQAIDADMSADLELDPNAAAVQSRANADCELRWQANDTFVLLPEGTISTYLVAAFSDDDAEPWRHDIAGALRVARSPRPTEP